jgi:hypothetical protein
MEIKIACHAADILPLERIEEFQKNLKQRSKKDIENIITSIEKYGFSFPFAVWNGNGHNYCLDGHGRIKALCEMRNRGYSLPMFPVVYVDAADEDEAKQKLLRCDSRYGQITMEGYLEFTEGMMVMTEELGMPEIKFDMNLGESRASAYKEKTELIIECASEAQANELYDEFKERGLICRISTL